MEIFLSSSIILDEVALVVIYDRVNKMKIHLSRSCQGLSKLGKVYSQSRDGQWLMEFETHDFTDSETESDVDSDEDV